MAIAYVAGGCISPPLPEVPEDVVTSIEGENVSIVARHEEPNPGNDWIDTRVVVEVSGPDSHIDEVAATLTTNGWDVHEVTYSPIVLLDANRAEAELGVFALDDFLSMGVAGPNDAFSGVDVKPQRSYYVMTIMPHF